jgi:hypothetical protein
MQSQTSQLPPALQDTTHLTVPSLNLNPSQESLPSSTSVASESRGRRSRRATRSYADRLKDSLGVMQQEIHSMTNVLLRRSASHSGMRQ